MKSTNQKFKQAIKVGSSLTFVCLVTFALFTGCMDTEKIAQYEEQNQQLLAERDSLANTLNDKEEAINNFMESLNEIETNLASIKEKEQLIAMKQNDSELHADGKDGIIKDIQLINTLMEENRKTMAMMKSKLNKAGVKIASFEKQVAQLNNKLDMREEAIERLKSDLSSKDFEIALLNQAVDTLSGFVMEQEKFIDEQDEALYTTYYAKGTYKELKENGVIETNGLFPWADRNKALNHEIAEGQFRKVDLREFTSVRLNAPKADLITKHPEGTYEFTETEGGQIASLEITHPDEFWKLSNYLVVEVK